MRRRALVPAAALVLLVGCGSGAPTSSPSPTASPTPTETASASPTPGPTASPTTRPTPSRTPTPRPTPSPTARPSSPAPTTTVARVLWKGSTSRHVVALTFDAGSDTGSTAAILDLLAARHVRATFGLTGAWVRANPALARRIVAAGHLVVNHTDRHLSFTGRSTGTAPLSRAQRAAALAGAEQALHEVGASGRPWFRPPYGDRDTSVDRDVGALGYRYELMWTVDTLGWKGVPASEVVARVLAKLAPGEIVLMHVGAASSDARALPDLLDALTARGYGFVRADGF